MKEIIQNIGNQVEYISIADPKFKTHRAEVMFMIESAKTSNAAYALASALLTASNAAYPSIAAMTKKLNTLYGASLNSHVSKRGDVLQISVCCTAIDSRYALHGEDLTAEMIQLLTGCLFAPKVESGAFQEPEFHIQKQDLLDAIEAEINEKRSYAMTRAMEEAFAGEPCSYPAKATAEEVRALDAKDVYTAYRTLLREAVIRIYHAGPSHVPALEEAMRNAFAEIERTPRPISLYTVSPCKPEVCRVTEQLPVTQSKLVLVFKGKEPKKGAKRLFSMLFGAAPFSMLFMNVREKLSLCYYCASRIVAGKNALLVDSGVELANVEKAHVAILEQLDVIRNGDFTEEMLDDAKKSIVDSLRGTGDTTGSCIAWSHAQFCDGNRETVEEAVARYCALTKQDVMDMANALQEDTVYLMKQEVQA